jgi:predicted nucleotidyltransferase
MMISLLMQRQSMIEDLCRRYRVGRLEVFGSAVAGNFDEAASDVDFLVEFMPLSQGEHADHYFGLKEDLEKLLGRPVDLVMTRAIKNRYFLQAVESRREVLYAA